MGEDDQRRPLLAGNGHQWLQSWVVAHRLVPQAITTIKAGHTVIFLILLGCVLHVTYAGVRDRVTRGTTASLVAIAGEAVILSLNGRRCPLTVMVEDLGAEHGQVSDIFLPDWIAKHILPISSAALGGGGLAFLSHRVCRWRR